MHTATKGSYAFLITAAITEKHFLPGHQGYLSCWNIPFIYYSTAFDNEGFLAH